MGCDIVATANHRLDTTSIERLAADVSARMQAVVMYGYDDADFNFVELGTTGSGQRVLRLSSLIEESDTPATIVYQLYDSNDYEQYNTWIYRD